LVDIALEKREMDVASTDRISRFLFTRRWFAPTTGRVKPEAFTPHPHVDLSVSCTEGLAKNPVWQLGREKAERHTNKPTLHGRADLMAHVIRNQRLEIVRDDKPLYHANVVGWDGEKAAQISKAQQIAAESKLVLLAPSFSPADR